jgi:hypothetical protein
MKRSSGLFVLACFVIAAAPARAPLSVIVLIDITASLHVCPGGVAGPPSTAPPPNTTPSGVMSPVGFAIPPAMPQFQLTHVAEDDRIRIGAIGRHLYLADRFVTTGRDRDRQWSAAFARPPVDWLGPSPIWDALIEASQAFQGETGARAIVLVTDGLATGNAHSSIEAADTLKAAGIRVAVVVEETILTMTPLTPMSATGLDPAKPLRAIAETTGGYFVLDKAIGDFGQSCFRRDPATALAAVFDWLHGKS